MPANRRPAPGSRDQARPIRGGLLSAVKTQRSAGAGAGVVRSRKRIETRIHDKLSKRKMCKHLYIGRVLLANYKSLGDAFIFLSHWIRLRLRIELISFESSAERAG